MKQVIKLYILQENIISIVDKIKAMIIDEKIHADLEKRDSEPIDIVGIIQELKNKEKNEDR